MLSIECSYTPRAFSTLEEKNSECKIGHALDNKNQYLLHHPRIEFYKKYQLTRCQQHGMLVVKLDTNKTKLNFK